MTWACLGCSRIFDTSKGVEIHRNSCKKFTATARQLLLKRSQREGRPDPAKMARIEGSYTSKNLQDCEGQLLVHDSVPHHGAIDVVGISRNVARDVENQMGSAACGLPDPAPLFSTRTRRQIKRPKGFSDFLPSFPTSVTQISRIVSIPDPEPPPASPPPTTCPPSPSHPSEQPMALIEVITTQPNDMGVYRSYSKRPTFDPEDGIDLQDIYDLPDFASNSQDQKESTSSSTEPVIPTPPPFTLFLNQTVFDLMNWYFNDSATKSSADLDRLVQEVLLSPTFDQSHLRGFNCARETKRLDDYEIETSQRHGWMESTVRIRLPAERPLQENESPIEFAISGILHRSLTQLVNEGFQDALTQGYHLTPFKQFWKQPGNPTGVRLYSEIYTSDAMLEEYDLLYSSPSEPGCNLEKVIAPIMLWSDSTQLANFGTASLWPIYVYFGNQSKYVRAKPKSRACHHLAYIPNLPDNLQDVYRKAYGNSASKDVLTHCKRDLMHAVWGILLDDEFMHAYVHGIVIVFTDGIARRVYPRIFTYSADYPEKVLLSTIRNLAQWPCPRCLIEKSQIHMMGTKRDHQLRQKTRVDSKARQQKVENARDWILNRGYKVQGAAVERTLKPESLVPTQNAFSIRLLPLMVNFFMMFVPDLLHEFELGVWKAFFIHLLRILVAWGHNTIQELNARYRQVPTFGRDAIRRFRNNVSDMKKMAARDFEDLLQCAIPVFDGLLPSPHNEIILDTLFMLATWHACAKLRLHTECTLIFLEKTTTSLGALLRRFVQQIDSAFDTKELPREYAARGRRNAKKSSTLSSKGKQPAITTPGPKAKRLNLNTYKLHSLGDYSGFIRRFGTSDSYSTQVGELEHRRVKGYFTRTNKNKYHRQISKHERRERLLRRFRAQQTPGRPSPCSGPSLAFHEADPMPYTDPAIHYHISQSQKHYLNITSWLAEHKNDPSLKDFLPRLKDHLLARILSKSYDGDEVEFTDAERSTVTLVNHRLYRHKVLRINYTTYDMRRAQDSLNPRTHADVMVLSHEDDAEDQHPYWYARILGVFHAYVRHTGPASQSTHARKMDFLWVRWFGRDLSHRAGWAAKRLQRVGFIDEGEPGAFGFLDPNLIVRGVHLIPAFRHGRTSDLLAPSFVRQPFENDEDWKFFHVNVFADRDMFMRFLGGAVGHRSTNTSDGTQTSCKSTTNQTCGEPDNEADNLQTYRNEENTHDIRDSESSDEEEDDEGEDERDLDDLGVEDGEDGDYDIPENEGYGAL